MNSKKKSVSDSDKDTCNMKGTRKNASSYWRESQVLKYKNYLWRWFVKVEKLKENVMFGYFEWATNVLFVELQHKLGKRHCLH